MADQGASLGDAVGRLAEQKTLAESHGTLLKQHVADQSALIDGQRLYDEARAKFDALIRQLVLDLTRASEPKDSAELRRALDDAIARRVAFSELVSERLPDREGARDALGIGDAAKAVAEVVNTLIQAAVDIWKEHRRGNELKQETIRNQVEATRWRPFDEL